VAIIFTPTTSGYKQATVTIQGNFPTFTFAIDGTGGSVKLSIVNDKLNLKVVNNDVTPTTADGTDAGTRLLSAAAYPTKWRVVANGNSELWVTSITKSGAGCASFILEHPSGFSSPIISPNYFLTSISFKPTATGLQTCDITVNSNAITPDNIFRFRVQGTGTNSPVSFLGVRYTTTGNDLTDGQTTILPMYGTQYSSINVASGSETHVFLLRNFGATTVTGIIGTSSSPDFNIGYSPPSKINPGQSMQFVVRFDPSVVGTRTATIEWSVLEAVDSFSFDLQGTGV